MRIALAVVLAACGGPAAPAIVSNEPQPPAPVGEPARPVDAETPPPRKKVSGLVQLERLEKLIKAHYNERAELPPTAAAMPGGTACGPTTHKFPRRPQAEWFADPGWRAVAFWIDGESLFTYQWTRSSPTAGVATAVADLDCDQRSITYRLEITVEQGKLTSTLIPANHADD